MFILNYIKQHTQRRAENKRNAKETRDNEAQRISDKYTGWSLNQISDLIWHEELKLARLPFIVRLVTRKKRSIYMDGLRKARKRIHTRHKRATEIERVSSIANAPAVVIQKKKAA